MPDVNDPAASETRRRVGVLGGAFDPPHRSHTRLARDAVEQLELDRLLVIPCGDHPTKPRAIAAPSDRLAMCRIAFGEIPGVEVSDLETRRDGPSFTVDTLETLRAGLSPREGLVLLIGSDNAPGLPSWSRAESLLQLARIVVYPRAGFPIPDGPYDTLDTAPDAVSSTAIRTRLALGERGLDDLLPTVEQYAAERRLYR